MHALKINDSAYHLPATWDEITPAQYRAVSPYLHLRPSAAVRSRVLFALLPRSARRLVRQADGGQIEALSFEALEWLWQPREVGADDDIRPLVQEFRLRGRSYHLPEHSLNDVTVWEWAHIEHYLDELRLYPSRRRNAHIALAAVICRPLRPAHKRDAIDFDGYPRQHFNPELIPRRIAVMQTLPPYVAFAIEDYLLRCKQMIYERYAIMFQGEKTQEEGFGWTGVILSIAESGVFGPQQMARGMGLHDVCLWCCKRRIEQENQKTKPTPVANGAD